MRATAILVGLTASATAHANSPPYAGEAPLRPALEADVGLSVIGLGYEHPVAAHVSVGAMAGITSTYFSPWFDQGDRTDGYVLGVRATWFARATGRGPYIAPFLRGARITTDAESGAGLGVAAGAFVGWAWRVGRQVDIRAGVGGQYMDYRVRGTGIDAPFIALDGVIAYRL